MMKMIKTALFKTVHALNCATILLLFSAIAAEAAPRVNIFLNNNPKANAQWESTIKNQKINMVTRPYIILKGISFSNGKTQLIVTFRNEVLIDEEIEVIQGEFGKMMPLENILADPDKIEVTVGRNFHEIIPIHLKRLLGTVKYFDGTPVRNPLISANENGMFVVGDEYGNFEMFLSAKINSIAIFDKNYSKTTLESWLYNVDLEEDQKIDFRIGMMELFRLHAWERDLTLYVHFTPMSLTLGNEVMKKGLKDEMSIALDPSFWPRLAQEDVKVFVGDTESPILMFKEVEGESIKFEEKIITAPAHSYLISIPREDYKGRLLRVEVNHRVIVGEEEVLERGEGFFGGFLNE